MRRTVTSLSVTTFELMQDKLLRQSNHQLHLQHEQTIKPPTTPATRAVLTPLHFTSHQTTNCCSATVVKSSSSNAYIRRREGSTGWSSPS